MITFKKIGVRKLSSGQELRIICSVVLQSETTLSLDEVESSPFNNEQCINMAIEDCKRRIIHDVYSNIFENREGLYRLAVDYTDLAGMRDPELTSKMLLPLHKLIESVTVENK